METIRDTFKRFCKTNGIQFRVVKDALVLILHSDQAVFECFVRFTEDIQFVQLETIIPMRVPQEKRHDMAVLVLDINCQITFGHFDFDLSEGLLVFKTGTFIQRYNGEEDRIYKRLIIGSLVMTDRFSVSFAKVIFENFDIDAYYRQEQAGDSGSTGEGSNFSGDPSLN